jgi:hypothetical protein
MPWVGPGIKFYVYSPGSSLYFWWQWPGKESMRRMGCDRGLQGSRWEGVQPTIIGVPECRLFPINMHLLSLICVSCFRWSIDVFYLFIYLFGVPGMEPRALHI